MITKKGGDQPPFKLEIFLFLKPAVITALPSSLGRTAKKCRSRRRRPQIGRPSVVSAAACSKETWTSGEEN